MQILSGTIQQVIVKVGLIGIDSSNIEVLEPNKAGRAPQIYCQLDHSSFSNWKWLVWYTIHRLNSSLLMGHAKYDLQSEECPMAPTAFNANTQIALANMLIERMAQLSADSIWARRASGYRGTLLKLVTRLENDPVAKYSAEQQRDYAYLGELIPLGFALLEKAAQEY
jgi:hypothetical protein